MEIIFSQVSSADRDILIDWLSSDVWPYHVNQQPDAQSARKSMEEDAFYGEDSKSFWIISDSQERVGLIRLFDLLDPAPMFDLRVRSIYRGKGIGTKAVRWFTDHIFKTMPDKIRVEGQTRQDNVVMRRIFRQCGYVKEAHYRKSWPADNGVYLDSIGYGITRDDWTQQKTTPVNWNDEEF